MLVKETLLHKVNANIKYTSMLIMAGGASDVQDQRPRTKDGQLKRYTIVFTFHKTH